MQTVRVVSVLTVLAALGAAFWFMRSSGPATGPAAVPTPAPDKASRGLVEFLVAPCIDDRFVQEPCALVPGGGLYSLGAAVNEVKKRQPGVIALSMGDLTLAEGGMGRHTVLYHYTEVMPRVSGEWIVAPGEGELGTGVDFVRDVLTRVQGVTFLCANAADSSEPPLNLMRSFQLLKSAARGVLIIGVAADSMQDELRRRGSAVRILPAAPAVAAARTEGLEQAARLGLEVEIFVLLVHGTVAETAELLEVSPGFTFAAAAHGPELAESEPRRVNGAQILYGGQSLRFVWRLIVPADGNPPATSLVRIGQRYAEMGCPYSADFAFFRDMSSKSWMNEVATTPGERPPDPRGKYVGAKKCAECHASIAAEHAETPHGLPSYTVQKTSFSGSTGCIGCHTTAPYRDTGWPGPPDLSDMASISCEACHGPGEEHAASQSKGYGKVEFASCLVCHPPDKTRDFDPEAIWKNGGHKLIR